MPTLGMSLIRSVMASMLVKGRLNDDALTIHIDSIEAA
jgi:hypothetical protein